MIAGMRVVETINATKRERTFPESKHRSARIRKKLIKRHGSEFFDKPAAYVVDKNTLVIHPELLRALMREAEANYVDEAIASIKRMFASPPMYSGSVGGIINLKDMT